MQTIKKSARDNKCIEMIALYTISIV